jgi:hypothetical protein
MPGGHLLNPSTYYRLGTRFRGGRYFGSFEAATKSRKKTLAEDAVSCEPVSAGKFPITGKFIGNFA